MINKKNPDFTNTPVDNRRPKYNHTPSTSTINPKVTIVTPFYNTDDIFYETAQCIFGQTMQQWEWLIINDGSNSPNSLNIIEEYRTIDPRVRVIDHQENRGLPAARNSGYEAARADYILQLDSDDLIEPTAIEIMLWYLTSHPEYSFVKGYSIGFGAEQYLWDYHGLHRPEEFLKHNIINATAMVRSNVRAIVGGYNESMRGGLEDWDFWLRCAHEGLWGATIPEYLDWYRRRVSHDDRWHAWNEIGHRTFIEQAQHKYPELWQRGVPQIAERLWLPNERILDELPCDNLLAPHDRRLLLLVPWMTMGGADKFNLDLTRLLRDRGWQITIVATATGDNQWAHEFAIHTPDIFILPHFLHPTDYPRFIRYLIHSRGFHAAMITNSEVGYLLLPYLRAHFPDLPIVDYNHMEEETWKNGGHAQTAALYQSYLNRTIVSSTHLKGWMAGRGADAGRIDVCTTDVDSNYWSPDPTIRRSVRLDLDIDDELPLILYAGRICEQKQPHVFGQTIQLLAKRDSPFLALVAGDGPDLPELRALITSHHLEKYVHFLGRVPNTRIRELLAASDIFFLPSQMEGISLAIYEAMAMENTIVGARVGGQHELVTPECGMLISRSTAAGEAEDYAAALSLLIDDPERRAAYGQAARRRVVEHFSIDRLVPQFEAILERAALPESSAATVTGGAQTLGSQAIEYLRMSQLAERLWHERLSAPPAPLPLAPTPQPGYYDDSRVSNLQDWIAELEEGKAWLEQERRGLVDWNATLVAQAEQQRSAWTSIRTLSRALLTQLAQRARRLIQPREQ